MTPDYREGDIVVFSPARPVKSGMDCFARIEPDHESTFKRVFIEPGTGVEAGRELIRLQPLNPRYAARTLPREQVAGLYAAVSITRAI
jgi:SOS-response transcriptional repressor LexA